jgi:transposase
MPWRETWPMEQRLEFIREYESELFTMTELAAQYGISRKTGYKWLAQYEATGALGLCDRSRRPHSSPQATAPELVEALLVVRRRHPHWGAKKLLTVATRRDPRAAWPSRSTVCAWLKQRGFVTPRRRRIRSPHAPASSLTPIVRANQVWTDFKGEFRTGDGVYCYPLTLRDGLLCAPLRRVAGAHGHRDSAAPCSGLRRVRLAGPDSQRQRSAVCQSGVGRPLDVVGLVDPLGHHPGTHRAGPSRAKRIA